MTRTYPARRQRPLTGEERALLAADYQTRARAAQALTRARTDAALGVPAARPAPAAGGGAAEPLAASAREWTLTLLLERGEWMSANDRTDFRKLARAKRRVREMAEGIALLQRAPAMPAARLLVVVGYPSRRRADPDNAQPVVKAAVDGLVDAGVLPDDDHEHLIHAGFRRAPELAPPGRHLVRLHLTPVLPDDLTLED